MIDLLLKAIPFYDGLVFAGIVGFFQSLKRERIRQRTYLTCDDASHDVFELIEMFYNLIRKHINNEMLSPID